MVKKKRSRISYRYRHSNNLERVNTMLTRMDLRHNTIKQHLLDEISQPEAVCKVVGARRRIHA
jgi:hypothetical protein